MIERGFGQIPFRRVVEDDGIPLFQAGRPINEALKPHNGEFATGREREKIQNVGELAVGDIF